jgi:hypothetical protein
LILPVDGLLPLSIRRWQTPYYAPSALPFDQNKTVNEELSWIETDFLVPRPAFAYLPMRITIATAIAAVGLLGWLRLKFSWNQL